MGFQYSLIYLSGSIMQWVINRFGTGVIGAFAATNQIENLIQQPFTALGTAIATYTGQNAGAGHTERIRQGLHSALKICAVYAIALVAVFWGFGNLIMGIFVSDDLIIKKRSNRDSYNQCIYDFFRQYTNYTVFFKWCRRYRLLYGKWND